MGGLEAAKAMEAVNRNPITKRRRAMGERMTKPHLPRYAENRGWRRIRAGAYNFGWRIVLQWRQLHFAAPRALVRQSAAASTSLGSFSRYPQGGLNACLA